MLLDTINGIFKGLLEQQGYLLPRREAGGQCKAEEEQEMKGQQAEEKACCQPET